MNKFLITGNLTRKPELKKSEKGMSYTILSVANNTGKTTNFFDVKVFDKLAERCVGLLGKGYKVLASCYLINNNYESKKPCHCKHSEISIIASAIEMMQQFTYDINEKDEQNGK